MTRSLNSPKREGKDIKTIDTVDTKKVFGDIGRNQELSWYHETGIVNNTNRTVYVCTSSGIVGTLHPNRINRYPSTPDSITVLSRAYDGTDKEREFGFDGRESAEQTVYSWTIHQNDLLEGCYVRELDLVLSFSKTTIKEMHPKSEENIKRQISKKLNMVLDSKNHPPIKVHVNDPTGILRHLYLAIGKEILLVPVMNEPSLVSQCKIFIRNTETSYTEFNLNLHKVLNGEVDQIQTLTDLILVAPTQEKIKHAVFSRTTENENLYTKAQLKLAIEKALNDVQTKLEETLEKLRVAEALNKSRALELKHMEDLLSRKSSYDYEQLKIENERLKQDHERFKIQSNKESTKSDNESNTITNALKVFGAVLGTAVAVLAFVKK